MGLFLALAFTIGVFADSYVRPSYSNKQPSNYFNNINETSVIYLEDFYVGFAEPTPSMLPCIPFNSKVLAVDPDNLSVGDFIIFDHPKSELPLVHMIVREKNGKYLTRGVNQKLDDGTWLMKEDIIKKVVGVLY